MKNNLITKVLITLILILALGLRVYKLESIPPSLSWDEASVGYNAWTIANYGRDEYGQFLPLYFRSFGEGKNPVDIYITSIFVKFLGLNEISTRLPSTVVGVLNVLLIYFLVKILFGNELIALLSSLFLTISPYNIHFSRFNHEANFALFFFMLGIFLFLKSIKNHKYLLPVAILSFITSFLSYNPPKLIAPVMLLVLLILYANRLLKNKLNVFISFVVLSLFILFILTNREILGTERIKQTAVSSEQFEKTNLFKITGNRSLGRLELTAIQYSWHFTPQYLFIQGDKNPRLSSQTGEFYKIDAIFLILGILYLIYRRSKEGILLLVWAAVAPLPSGLVAEAPHAARAGFMMGSWHLISALGFYFIIRLVRRPIFKIIVVVLTVIILAFSLQNYLNYYYGEYAKRYAIEWQYGMKQIVEFVKQHKEYNQVFVTDVRSQPYIFFLYYLKIPLQDYLHTVIYNNNLDNRSYNSVAILDRFSFGGWDPVESIPRRGILYIITPSQYDGLRYKSLFDVKKIIYYPNGVVAFYIVSGNE